MAKSVYERLTDAQQAQSSGGSTPPQGLGLIGLTSQPNAGSMAYQPLPAGMQTPVGKAPSVSTPHSLGVTNQPIQTAQSAVAPAIPTTPKALAPASNIGVTGQAVQQPWIGGFNRAISMGGVNAKPMTTTDSGGVNVAAPQQVMAQSQNAHQNAVTDRAGGLAPGTTSGQDKFAGEQSKVNDQWADIMKQYGGSLKDAMKGSYADEALAGRRMSEMNAQTGGGVSGAFAGGAAQTAIGGEQARLQARNAWNKQGLEMKMAYLSNLMKQAEASKDRDMQGWLQSEADKTQLMMAQMTADTAAADRAAASSTAQIQVDEANKEANSHWWD